MTRRRWLVTVAAAAVLLSAGCAQQLRSSRGLGVGHPVDINDADQILAVAYAAGIPHGVLLAGPGGSDTLIAGPDGAGFVPYALNDRGVVVGALITGTGRTQTSRAARWSSGDGFEPLPLPAGTFQSWATDVNNRGDIVVNAYSPSGGAADGAYVWLASIRDLVRLAEPPGAPNGRASVAEAINESGLAVGASGNGASAGNERAVVWSASTRAATFLSAPGTASHALDVNEVGTIVGTAQVGAIGEPQHAAAWYSPARVFLDLGPGEAEAVNDANVAVGQAGTPARATAWSIPTRLSMPLGELADGTGSNATALNNRGRAVGDADGDSVHYSFPAP